MRNFRLKHNGYFALIMGPYPHKQHQNQQNGLDEYVTVLNFASGEECRLKLYQGRKGKHFKMRGTHYLDEFTKNCIYTPYQVIDANTMEDL